MTLPTTVERAANAPELRRKVAMKLYIAANARLDKTTYASVTPA